MRLHSYLGDRIEDRFIHNKKKASYEIHLKNKDQLGVMFIFPKLCDSLGDCFKVQSSTGMFEIYSDLLQPSWMSSGNSIPVLDNREREESLHLSPKLTSQTGNSCKNQAPLRTEKQNGRCLATSSLLPLSGWRWKPSLRQKEPLYCISTVQPNPSENTVPRDCRDISQKNPIPDHLAQQGESLQKGKWSFMSQLGTTMKWHILICQALPQYP